MLISPTLLASIEVSILGVVVWWSNPRRLVNRAVCTCSFHIAIWLGCLYLATTFPQGSAEGLFCLRLACAVGGLIPMHYWIVKECISTGMQVSRRRIWIELGVWMLISIPLAAICFTDLFIPSYSTHTRRAFGWGYNAYIVTALTLYFYLFVDAFRTVRKLVGARRTELSVWLLGGCGLATAVLTLMAVNALTHDPRYIRLQPLVILIFYTATAVAVTTYRIFDARQIFLVGLQKVCLVAVVTGVAFGADVFFAMLLPEPMAFVVTTAVALWFAAILNGWLDKVFHFYPQATAARQAAFAAAQRETRVDKLEGAFGDVLKGWGQSEYALVMSGAKGALTGGGVDLPENCTVVRTMQQLRWATPERLARERPTPDRVALMEFLTKQTLGVLVVAEGPSLTALIGVGVAASRRPFTYPQVTRLQELASIIENAIERAHFSVKAQCAEQLATVGLLGASLAHESRNPLVSIKAFVQLLPQHYHDPVFRDKFFHLIGDEVMRIDRLTEQLLDLASPRVYTAQAIELNTVLHSTLELVAAKATDKHIQFLTDLQAAPDRIYTDASAAKQVLLNLCFNAIQALEARAGERWVKLSTRNAGNRVEVIVEDSGPGIAPEIRPRLFQPFQSTKSSGFGLGLAICSDILTGLDATITVDANEPGRGATFRILFPCPA